MRMLNGSRKTDFRRRALTPTKTGQLIWGFPTVWLMGHETGYWETTVVRKLEERPPRASRKMILNNPTDKTRAAGETDGEWKREGEWNDWKNDGEWGNKEAYPAGMPLSATAIASARNFRPKSLENGAFLRWDYSTHAGCRAHNGERARGKHEVVKTKCAHPMIRMDFVRMGRKAGKKIPVNDMDGHVQNLRSQLTEEDRKYQRRTKPKFKPKEGVVASGCSESTAHTDGCDIADTC